MEECLCDGKIIEERRYPGNSYGPGYYTEVIGYCEICGRKYWAELENSDDEVKEWEGE